MESRWAGLVDKVKDKRKDLLSVKDLLLVLGLSKTELIVLINIPLQDFFQTGQKFLLHKLG